MKQDKNNSQQQRDTGEGLKSTIANGTPPADNDKGSVETSSTSQDLLAQALKMNGIGLDKESPLRKLLYDYGELKSLEKDKQIFALGNTMEDYKKENKELKKKSHALLDKVIKLHGELRHKVAEDGVRLLTGKKPKMAWQDAFDLLHKGIEEIKKELSK